LLINGPRPVYQQLIFFDPIVEYATLKNMAELENQEGNSDAERDKEAPAREEPSGAPRRRGARASVSRSVMPSPRAALLWAKCYLCHKSVPLCRIKAHVRLSHAGEVMPKTPIKDEDHSRPLSGPHPDQLNILDLTEKTKSIPRSKV